MNTSDIMKLVNAGFTKAEIQAMAAADAPAPAPADDPAPAPAADPAPVPAPAPAPAPAPVPAADPAPAPAPAPADPAGDAITKLTAEVTRLTTLVQKANFLNSEQPQLKRETPEDVIASIIFPTFKAGDNK